jgi:hypothetical protein
MQFASRKRIIERLQYLDLLILIILTRVFAIWAIDEDVRWLSGVAGFKIGA